MNLEVARAIGTCGTFAAWEAAVLPLNYTREAGDLTQVTCKTQITVSLQWGEYCVDCRFGCVVIVPHCIR